MERTEKEKTRIRAHNSVVFDDLRNIFINHFSKETLFLSELDFNTLKRLIQTNSIESEPDKSLSQYLKHLEKKATGLVFPIIEKFRMENEYR